VIDIYAETGIAKPDLSLIDESFIAKFKTSANPNLQIEMLKKLLGDEIRRVGKRNIVTGKAFSEMLEASVLRYQNRSLDAAQVVAELVALAQALKSEGDRGSELGLNEDELAFYDAICANNSAVMELGDETLKKIAHELVDIVRRDAKTDWSVKEQVRAKLRATIKRLLLRYGYPPDREPAATQLVLEQAEAIAGDERA
jgi:type I restriction enzyme R subunit